MNLYESVFVFSGSLTEKLAEEKRLAEEIKKQDEENL